MRSLALTLFVTLLVAGCAVTRTIAPNLLASNVDEAWILKMCGAIPMHERDPCSGNLRTVSPGICAMSATSAFVRKNDTIWCGITNTVDAREFHQNGTLIWINGRPGEFIPAGISYDLDSKAIAAAAVVAIAYAASDEADKSDNGYDFSGTQGLNSSELGNELLSQKRQKNIAGAGKVVTPLPNYRISDDVGSSIPQRKAKTIPSIGYAEKEPNSSINSPKQASIGYDPKTAAMSLQYKNPNFCRYSSTQTLIIQKLASVSCPRSVEIPSPTSSFVFDYGKFFTKRGQTGTKVAQTQTSCTYRLPLEQRNITMPKGSVVACPSSYDF